MRHFATLLLLLLTLPLSAYAEINFITLKHRNAENLVPLLQPVLDEEIRISGQGATLIVNSKPWQLEEIRSLVEQFDTPLQLLLISVMQGGEENRTVLQGGLSGSAERPNVRLYGTHKNEQEMVSQQLRVIEGEWAAISAGESLPIILETTGKTAHGITTQRAMTYQEVSSGFEVKPSLRGQQVTMEIRPFRAKRATSGGGVIEQQEIITTISGKLGEWITVGGVDEQQSLSGSGTVYTTGKQRSTTHSVKLRVDIPAN